MESGEFLTSGQCNSFSPVEILLVPGALSVGMPLQVGVLSPALLPYLVEAVFRLAQTSGSNKLKKEVQLDRFACCEGNTRFRCACAAATRDGDSTGRLQLALRSHR